MEVCATDLFWYLVEEKGQVVPSAGPSTYTKTVTMKEDEWERFKTIKGVTGRMQSDYTLVPTPAETDLDSMAEPFIEPTCHPQVLYDKSRDLTFSKEIGPLKQKVERGKKSRFEGGDAKNYGRNHVRKQFMTLDMNRDLLRKLNVSHRVTEIDEQFATEVPNLQELSLSGHSLKEVKNLPPKLISLNAHCNRLTEWPQLPNDNFRHIGLSGNMIGSLEALSFSRASSMSLLTSLDLSSNSLKLMGQLAPLEPIPFLSVLKLAGNPITLLPNYRPRVVCRFPNLEIFDGSAVVDMERTSALAQFSKSSLSIGMADEGGAEQPPSEEAAAGEEGAEGEERPPPPPKPVEPDFDGTFKLKFTLGMLEGLKPPNPAPAALPEGEEEPDPPRREVVLFDFYKENPPMYYMQISLPNLPDSAGRTDKIPWAQTPRPEDASEEDPIMDFQFDKTVTFEASPSVLHWLRFGGVQVQLFQERLAPPPEPEPPKEQGEEGEGEEGEGEETPEAEEAGAGEEEGGEEEEEVKLPEMIVTPLARATVVTETLVNAGAVIKLKAELEKHLEAMVTVRPLDDQMVHNALKAAKEAERARKKGKDPKKEDKDKKKDEKKSVVTDEMPRKKLLGLVEFSVELNPAKPEPPEGGE